LLFNSHRRRSNFRSQSNLSKDGVNFKPRRSRCEQQDPTYSVSSPTDFVTNAVARIAYIASDVILSVQPSLGTESEFSHHLKRFALNKAKGFVSRSVPEIIPLRYNADPLLSAYSPLRFGRLVSVTTSSSILLSSIPHLYKLAQYPIVLHVSLQTPYADFSEISSIRQCGFSFIHSETLQEAQDIALTAHALAIRSGKGVIHFFDPGNSIQDNPIAPESRDIVQRLLSLDTLQPFEAHDGDDFTLYADDGRVATIPDLGVPFPHEQVSLPSASPQAQPSAGEVSSKASSADSSVGSSNRDSSADSAMAPSSATTVEVPTTRAVTAADIFKFAADIWSTIKNVTSRTYHAVEYSGPENAEAALFIFGSTGIFVDALDDAATPQDLADLGIITARLYRPWLGTNVTDSIPKTVKRIAVLEQVRRKTTKWGPMFLDILSSLSPALGGNSPITLVGYRVGQLEPATALQALRGISQNLRSTTPIQNLSVGNEPVSVSPRSGGELQQPQSENAYLKILNQLFGDRLYLANQLKANHAGISADVAASPEYGFGSLLARIEHRKRFVEEVRDAARSKEFITETPKSWLSKWALSADDSNKANSVAPEVIARLSTDGSRLATDLLSSKGLFFHESQWLIGSDAWAYDLGNSGVHHVIASGANVNMLIIDSQPYSERSAHDATRRKKDIGLYAMNYGNAYVASVAVYGSYTQVLQAMVEADRFNGPSVVVAYLPYNKENDSALTVLQETKKAVDLGYWPLYRWDPAKETEGEPTFSLDSERIKQELEDFLRRDNQLTQLVKRYPDFAANLSGSYGTEVRKLQKRRAKDAFEQLLEGLYGAPLTILYASDNGNAESLAKRLANRGKARGLKSVAIAMDDYPFEDLVGEENVVLITSTAGQGEFPQNGRTFWETIKNATDLDLSNVQYSVFALGDSHYWPRKEDKIYYNKPGKDLDARVSFLGAKQLTPIGLGDDQDPDGYQTGYADWEPKLWQALNVDKVEGLPEEPPPLTNEDIKIESNYLRGTIAQGLLDTSTGAISASDQQLTKFHGTYQEDDRDLRDERKAQGLEPAYQFMIRCRLPGGVATPEQWLQMDAVSSAHGNETMKLTTRQTFQFHGVIKSKLRPAMRAINAALMTTIAACGDVNRNVMCSALPEKSEFHAQVFKCSQKINDHLLPSTTAYHEIWIKDETTGKNEQVAGDAIVDHEPLYGKTYLPRKFKISIAIPPHNDVDVYCHDIGLIAIKSGETGHLAGFNVLAGGGMGTTHNMKKWVLLKHLIALLITNTP
jgi:sulfite reductase (NADPH) hemoprotein beta-component